MNGKFIKGMTAGMMIGTAAGMMAIAQMDNSTRRRVRKSVKNFRNGAEDAYDYMRGMMR